MDAFGHVVQLLIVLGFMWFIRYHDEKKYAEHANVVILLLIGACALVNEYPFLPLLSPRPRSPRPFFPPPSPFTIKALILVRITEPNLFHIHRIPVVMASLSICIFDFVSFLFVFVLLFDSDRYETKTI